jgi:hypothetical protein
LFYKISLLKVRIISRYEKTFIMTGVELPSPSMDPSERQLQLKQVAAGILAKLDPELSVPKLVYVKVVKTPRPSILEVECENVER